MGNEQSMGSPSDLDSMKRFAGMSPGQVLLIKEKFELMADEDLTIDKPAFVLLLKLNKKENEAEKIFSLFDLANDGRIDSHEFICALALISQANLKEKSEIIFGLYDFDHNRTITKNEFVILVKTTMTAIGAMANKGEWTILEAEKKAEDILRRYDTNRDSSISLQEFQSLVSKDSEILLLLYQYGIISREDFRKDYGGSDLGAQEMPQTDSDIENENERIKLAFDAKTEKKLQGIEHKQGIHGDEDQIIQQKTYQQFQTNNRNKNHKLWLDQIKGGAPSNWKPGKGDECPPVACLDLEYIYGFRCYDTRNNIKFTANGEVVYPMAAVGVALDPIKNQQKFFLEHSDDVISIDVYENRIATGQVGNQPVIFVWEVGKGSLAAFKGILKYGVQYLCFSSDGQKLVGIGMDPNHSIVVYDVEKALNNRGTGKKDEFLIASGKGPTSEVFDIKFDKVDKNIIIACKNEVYFATYDNLNVKILKGTWEAKICPFSAVLCIGSVENQYLTGTFKGQLLVWKGSRATHSIDAHKGAVTGIFTRKCELGVITAGNDGAYIIWSSDLKPKQKVQISDLNLKILNIKISAVAENATGTVIVLGTRGGDIIEIQGVKNRIIMRGHSKGHLRGLTIHSKNQQFYTIGEDNILGYWSIKDRKLISCVQLDFPSRAINISQDSRFLAVGALNGTIIIIDPKTLIPTFNFKDRDAEVSCIKFSHDTEILAVGHAPPACEILLYSIKNHFKKTNVLRGSPSTILSIDFSMNCRVLQVNDYSCQVIYYEISGEGTSKVQREGAIKYRDEKWSTYTAIYGWQVQGIWPEVSSGNDINAVDRTSRGQLIVTADDFSGIKLFRFPASNPNQGYLRYSGHSAHVSNVRFTCDDEYLISLGGIDKSIFQWKFNFNQEIQKESDANTESIPDQKIIQVYKSIQPNDIHNNNGEEQQQITNKQQQYLGQVKQTVPSLFKLEAKNHNQLPNGSLNLNYVFGFKTQDPHQEALNQIKYSANQKLIFISGSLAVVMDNKIDNKFKIKPQTFFKQHKCDITAIALHYKRNIVATGGRSFGLQSELVPIFVWDIESKQILSNICDFHLRQIYAMSFTPDGVFLISVGGDLDYSMTVHDWANNQLICVTKTGRSPIQSILIKSQTEFVTCGLKSVNFYTMVGRNLKYQVGICNQFEPITAAVMGFQSNECITGSEKGNIILWKDSQAYINLNKVHDGKVTSLCYIKNQPNQVYSAGLDGKICILSLNLATQKLTSELFYEISKCKFIKSPMIELNPSNGGIISMDIYNDIILIGTISAEIHEIPLLSKKPTLLQQGHFGGELWGLACSPTKNHIATCGGDNLIRIWDLDQKILIRQLDKPLDNDFRSVDWSSDDSFIVVGDTKGYIYLFDTNLNRLGQPQKSKYIGQKVGGNMFWITDIKFSPDSKKIALGAYVIPSNFIEIWDIEGNTITKQRQIALNLSGALTNLDWAKDNQHIVVNSSQYELKFINIQKEKDIQGSLMKDNIEWHTWTCPLGFPVQGIYGSKDQYEVTSVCASNSKQIIATGNYDGIIRLFKYPVVWVPLQVNRQYAVHGSKVTRIRFNYDDSLMISISALDRSIMIWQTDFGKSQQLGQNQENDRWVDDDTQNLSLITPKIKLISGQKYGNKLNQNKQYDDGPNNNNDKGGEEYITLKPWMSVIKEPTTYYKDPLNQNKSPKISLNIEYVYGYRARDAKNNLRYLKNGCITYHTAALAIVLDSTSNTQKIFNKHDDDITCLDVHPDGIKIATGQIGAKPKIYVWDSNTFQVICCFKGIHSKGFGCLSFNLPLGERLAAVEIDDQHQLNIYDITTKSNSGGILIYQDRIGSEQITDIKWKNENQFTTVGINHLRCWQITSGGLISKKATFDKQTSTQYMSIVFNGEDTIVGAADGTIQIYKEYIFHSQFNIHEAGKSVDALFASKDFICTGGRDSQFGFVDVKQYRKFTFPLTNFVKGAISCEIRSIAVSQDSRSLLIGTAGSEIYELISKEQKISLSSKNISFTSKQIMKSHYSKVTQNGIWGLAVNPNETDTFYTCGDDGTLRSWSLSQHKMINSIKISTEDNQESKQDDNAEVPDTVKGRCIEVSQDGVSVIVGFKDGKLRPSQKISKESISDIKLSKDQSILAVGSHDNNIYILNFPDLKAKNNKPLKKHQSYITHIDFSLDGNSLHSTCGGNELLYWEINTGKQNTLGQTQLRDEKWNTWTSPFGWPVQGLWDEVDDGSDINTVDRSHQTISGSDKPPDNYYLVASGDDHYKLKIFRYPCVKKGSQYILGLGHSSYITQVKFSMDDQYLLSIGGEDNTIIQWKVTKQY